MALLVRPMKATWCCPQLPVLVLVPVPVRVRVPVPVLVRVRVRVLVLVLVLVRVPVLVREGPKSVDNTFPETISYVSMSTKVPLFSGCSKESNVPAGRAANASLVGAKTVKGPGELRVATKSAATIVATKVLRLLTDCASSTRFFGAGVGFGGSSTPSMMCITPFVA